MKEGDLTKILKRRTYSGDSKKKLTKVSSQLMMVVAWDERNGLVFAYKIKKTFFFDKFGGPCDKSLLKQFSKPV